MDKIAMEYGDGLFELAKEERIDEELLAQTRLLRSVIEKEPSYVSLITSRKISREEKNGLLDEAFKNRVHPCLYNFLRLMNDRGYFSYVSSSFARYEERYYLDRKIRKVTVRSAAELSDPEKAKICAGIEQKTGTKCEITWLVDKSLVAGIRAESDGLLLENSAKSRFEDLKRHLSTAVTTNF